MIKAIFIALVVMLATGYITGFSIHGALKKDPFKLPVWFFIWLFSNLLCIAGIVISINALDPHIANTWMLYLLIASIYSLGAQILALHLVMAIYVRRLFFKRYSKSA